MKKRITRAMLVLALLGLNITASATNSIEPPQGDPFEQPVKMRVTCYLDEGTTASGTQTRKGIIATKREWMQEGYTFEIWAIREDGQLGDFLGYYEPKDTGYGIDTGEGESKIKKGRHLGSIERGWSIDVFCEDMAEVKEWQALGDYFYVQIVEGRG